MIHPQAEDELTSRPQTTVVYEREQWSVLYSTNKETCTKHTNIKKIKIIQLQLIFILGKVVQMNKEHIIYFIYLRKIKPKINTWACFCLTPTPATIR